MTTQRIGHKNSTHIVLVLTAFVGIGMKSGNIEAATITIGTTAGGTAANDQKCSLEEAVTALTNHANFHECTWGGTEPIGTNDTIVIPSGWTVNVWSSMSINPRNASYLNITIKSSQANSLATIQAVDHRDSRNRNVPFAGTQLFSINHEDCPGVTPANTCASAAFIFQDLHLIGKNKNVGNIAGIAVSGNGEANETLMVTRSWIEKFSDGGINDHGSNVWVFDSTIDGNSNNNDNGGGGIFFEGSPGAPVGVWLENSSVTNNESNGGGGIHIQSDYSHGIVNSTISGNSTTVDGGGISFGNTRIQGWLQVIGSTIAFNKAARSGGGVHITPGHYTSLTGSIVAKNTQNSSPSDWVGDLLYVGSSLLGALSGTNITYDIGENLFGVDPKLNTTLSDNGGVGGHHPRVHTLTSTSPAIDAMLHEPGYNPEVGPGELQDESHLNRGFDHSPSNPPGKVFDMGASERRSVP